jgi:acyl-homoserine-lactone acylase
MLAVAPANSAAPTYRATITRTQYDIPHIVADNWGSLGFGSGYAAAETSICTLADTVLAARGQRSKYLGPEGKYDDQVAMNGTNLQVDALATDLHNRKVVEKLLDSPAGPTARTRAMVAGYAEGVNQYLRDIGGAAKITDPKCKGAAYIEPTATELDLWYGVYLANILASSGFLLKEIIDADPPSLNEPGLPATPADAIFAPLPNIPLDPAALPNHLPIGSNATALGKNSTSTGSGMILGNPHFPWRGRYRFTQQHLTIPGEYNVAGASLIGSPAVNIGWNNNVAWSHTVSTAYRFTPYEYRTVLSPTQYLTTSGLKQLERRTVQVEAKVNGSIKTLTEDMYRTPQGYVIDAPALFMGWTPLSFFAIRDANGEHLKTLDTFLDMGTGTSVSDLLAKQDAQGGMPWVNTVAADRAGQALYADHSVVPHVSNAKTDACLTPIGRVLFQVAGLPALDGARADGDCKWGTDVDAQRPGIFGPGNLPKAVRPDWVMNANDSYWLPNPAQKLEGFARIIGCEKCIRTHRSRMVYGYPMDHLAGTKKMTPEILRGTEHENKIGLGRAIGPNAKADLAKVCELAEGSHTDACRAIAAWRGTSDKDEIGYVLVESFAVRLPAKPAAGPDPIWHVQFDPNDPVNTPRDLVEDNDAVVTAMKGAITKIRQTGKPLNAPWGEFQVAGDDGVEAIALGGGEGDKTGNANALASRNPVQNADFAKPVTYGSSHIQAVSFLAGDKVDARTMLTYGQSENENRPSHQDQTKLFGDEKWVSFPWTTAEIAAQQTSKKVVTNAGSTVTVPNTNQSNQSPAGSTPGSSVQPANATCGRRAATIVGTGRSETIHGTPGNDVIAAGGGDDVVNGKGGSDRICGGDGDDTLAGGSGDDALVGGAGADALFGQGGTDKLFARDGTRDRRLSGGRSSDKASRDRIDPKPRSVP